MRAKLLPRDHSRDLWAKLTREMGFSATGFLFLFRFIFARAFTSIYNFSAGETGRFERGKTNSISRLLNLSSFRVRIVWVIWKNYWVRNTIHSRYDFLETSNTNLKFYSLFVLFARWYLQTEKLFRISKFLYFVYTLETDKILKNSKIKEGFEPEIF